ncbi:hypothetical protein M7I_4184 [Glarea lozoyensis 74030]|uniref:Uncharacterized protein n=1 Tax=Glarea lozoyensis (strain ATCC 74030 / MF5533) TaxID=1104152 RepID=H0ENI0_GLAL7|nr:hypothetical protein M7I_4184 [Glarea lozoyensis 74030]
MALGVLSQRPRSGAWVTTIMCKKYIRYLSTQYTKYRIFRQSLWINKKPQPVFRNYQGKSASNA